MRFITKTLSNSKFKRFLILTLLLILYILISAISYTNAVCEDIANSDTDEDQNLKYLVRDNIISYINNISSNATSKEETMKIAQEHIKDLEKIALDTVQSNGYNYSVKVQIGNFAFPSKKYGDIILPPGYYDALKVKIGEAKGRNWWCVMFPPLCFVDVSTGVVPDESKETMKENLSEEEYALISQGSNDIKVKFKIVEVLQNFTISGIFM